MLAGVFRFACCNGLVVGQTAHDIRIPHKGNVQHDVIEGAYRVLGDFQTVGESTQAMKALTLDEEEEEDHAFATAALALRFGETVDGLSPAPVTAEQLTVRRQLP
jgi:hypothetical protein